MQAHKFSLGDIVLFESGTKQLRTQGLYRVTRQLPAQGEDFQYRLKHEADGHERVARECLLIAHESEKLAG